MSGRRRLSAGKVRMLGDHRSPMGMEYHREWLAHVAWLDGHGYGLTLAGRQELARVCYRRVCWLQAVTALERTRRAREEGRGRRPNEAQVERMKRREGREDHSYQAALTSFRELAKREARTGPAPTSGEALVAAVRGSGNGGGGGRRPRRAKDSVVNRDPSSGEGEA